MVRCGWWNDTGAESGGGLRKVCLNPRICLITNVGEDMVHLEVGVVCVGVVIWSDGRREQ